MKEGNVLLGISVVIFVLSLLAIGVTYYSLLGLSLSMTGHAVAGGEVNVTVTQAVLANFTSDDNINWGIGAVDDGASFSIIDTEGNITDGTWGAVSSGFIIRNAGNVNVTLEIGNQKDADTFLGGLNPSYQYMVTNVNDDACVPPGGFVLGTYYEIALVPNVTEVCNTLLPNTSILLDLRLQIPSDSDLGILSDTIAVQYEQAI
jgi:hypothetical protein